MTEEQAFISGNKIQDKFRNYTYIYPVRFIHIYICKSVCVCMSMYIKYTVITVDRGCITKEASDAGGQGLQPQILLEISCDSPLGLIL